MEQITKIDISPLKKKFQQSCRWILFGSIIFESGKVIHSFLLMRFLGNNAFFGIIGTFFSLVFLTSRIIDLGATNALPPYWLKLTKNKNNFAKILFYYFLIPSIPLAIIAPIITLHLFSIKFATTTFFLFIIPLLIICETVRSFFRLLLHLAGKTIKIVIFELGAFALFLALTWIPLIFFHVTPTINQLFLPFLIDSIISVLYMSYLVYVFYKKLNVAGELTIRKTMTWKRLGKVRALNLMLRAGRDIFADNLLTPLFAIKCGLAQAGLFYFASTLAKLLREIIRGPLVFSGNALLAELSEESHLHKKSAFAELSRKLITIITPIFIILIIDYQALIQIARENNATGLTINFTLLFLLITLSESFFIMYEQFYIMEEATEKLFLFKLIDFVLFYILILSQKTLHPIQALLAIIAIRALSLTLIAVNAYATWQIFPNIKIGWKYAIRWLIAITAISHAILKITQYFAR